MDYSNKKVVAYPKLTTDEINRRANAIISMFEEFLEFDNLSGTEYYINKINIFEVVKRQDQRMYYYKVFHELDFPCEYKYIAIECFWINTLKPFMIIDETSPLYDCVNEKFSLYLILSMIKAVFSIYKPNDRFEYPSKQRIRDILYDFKFCSLSRESMISFVETFADVYGVGIEFIFQLKPNDISKALRGKNICSIFSDEA
jgi:hypothetical protein